MNPKPRKKKPLTLAQRIAFQSPSSTPKAGATLPWHARMGVRANE